MCHTNLLRNKAKKKLEAVYATVLRCSKVSAQFYPKFVLSTPTTVSPGSIFKLIVTNTNLFSTIHCSSYSTEKPNKFWPRIE